tara:strand:+ start:967 stop:1146 length:180 start_codon:yes stop_codon:yes gene_type:complete
MMMGKYSIKLSGLKKYGKQKAMNTYKSVIDPLDLFNILFCLYMLNKIARKANKYNKPPQ